MPRKFKLWVDSLKTVIQLLLESWNDNAFFLYNMVASLASIVHGLTVALTLVSTIVYTVSWSSRMYHTTIILCLKMTIIIVMFWEMFCIKCLSCLLVVWHYKCYIGLSCNKFSNISCGLWSIASHSLCLGFFSAFKSFSYMFMTPCIHRLWPSYMSLEG